MLESSRIACDSPTEPIGKTWVGLSSWDHRSAGPSEFRFRATSSKTLGRLKMSRSHRTKGDASSSGGRFCCDVSFITGINLAIGLCRSTR
jgi:hypothetical protein